MRKGLYLSAFLFIALCFSASAWAQESTNVAMLAIEEPEQAVPRTAQVTSVYGISADDYLPTDEAPRGSIRSGVREPASRPAFDLPDAFYFIGGPVFGILFLRVLVIFLNGFEEKRREEQRNADLRMPEAD